MYVTPNYKTKKALKEAVARGDSVRIFQPGIGSTPRNGKVCIEGPHSPEPHRFYAEAEVKDGIVVKVR